MTDIEVALPFWLDRPDHEATDVALAAADTGFAALWIGEMATYDAFALATSIGLRTPNMTLKVGPLAVGVRGPVGLALGVSSVASLTGCRVDLALGASSPAIVAGWHGRPWAHHVPVMRETIECLRSIFTGARVEYSGRHVNSRGFRLRGAAPDTRIALGAFGPGMIRLAAQHADEVVLNLASPFRVGRVRAAIDSAAAAAGRAAPRLTVWVPVAASAAATGQPRRLARCRCTRLSASRTRSLAAATPGSSISGASGSTVTGCQPFGELRGHREWPEATGGCTRGGAG